MVVDEVFVVIIIKVNLKMDLTKGAPLLMKISLKFYSTCSYFSK